MFFSKRIGGEAGFLLMICLLFFILRFPSLYEPYWYGDEGVYFTIGKALQHGATLYTDIWDNKPPLLYLFYMIFNDLFSIRSVSLVFGLASVISFFFLAREFFQQRLTTYITTLLFALFLALPTLEGNIANAENFLILPVLLSAFFFWRVVKNRAKEHASTNSHSWYYFFLSGILLGLAGLFKIVAVFDFSAFLLFALFFDLENSPSAIRTIRQSVKRYVPYVAGFFIPLVLVSIFFLLQGSLSEFLTTVFLRNVSYVGEKNILFIPQGFLLFKSLLLLLALVLLFFLKEHMSKRTLFILLWLAFSLFNAFFSQRPYIHYQLVLLPSLVLTFGMILSYRTYSHKIAMSILVGTVVILLYNTFPRWQSNMIIPYYDNFLRFLTGKKTITQYQAFFDSNTPRDYALADYLSLHTTPEEKVFLWGNNPQVYYLSNTLPTGRYTVSYHISTPEAVAEVKHALNNESPRFIVLMPGTELFPFTISEYSYKLTITDSAIYEKINQ